MQVEFSWDGDGIGTISVLTDISPVATEQIQEPAPGNFTARGGIAVGYVVRAATIHRIEWVLHFLDETRENLVARARRRRRTAGSDWSHWTELDRQDEASGEWTGSGGL